MLSFYARQVRRTWSNCTQQSYSWEANSFSANQGIPRILWNPKCITTITRAGRLTLSSARSIQPMLPCPISWAFILILSSHLRLCLPSGLFLSAPPLTKTLHAPGHMPRPSHSLWYDHPNNIWPWVQSGPGGSVGIATELRVGRSVIDSRWGRDFPPVQTGPGTHPAYYTMGTRSFPG